MMKAKEPSYVKQSILNNRPLSTVSPDPHDLEPLTPNHILLLKTQPILPPRTFQKSDLYARHRWKQVQYMADLFWHKWTRVPSITPKEAEMDQGKEEFQRCRYCPGGWPHSPPRFMAARKSNWSQNWCKWFDSLREAQDQNVNPRKAHNQVVSPPRDWRVTDLHSEQQRHQ